MSTAQTPELQRAARLVDSSKKLVDNTPYSEHFAPMYSYLQSVHDHALSDRSEPVPSQFSVDEVVKSGQSAMDDVKLKAPSQEGLAAAAKVWGNMIESAIELDHAVKSAQPKHFLDSQLALRSELKPDDPRASALDEEIIAIARTNKGSISPNDLAVFAAEYNLPPEMLRQMTDNPTPKDQAIMDKIHAQQKQHVVEDSLDVTEKSLMAVGATLIVAGEANPEVALVGGIIEGIAAIVDVVKNALTKKQAPEQHQTKATTAEAVTRAHIDPQRPNWAQQMTRPEPRRDTPKPRYDYHPAVEQQPASMQR